MNTVEMTKVTIDRSVVELALEALELIDAPLNSEMLERWEQKTDLSIAALRQALDQPAQSQEPCAFCGHKSGHDSKCMYLEQQEPTDNEPYLNKAYRLADELRNHLSTVPQQRKPLTDEFVNKVVRLQQPHLDTESKAWKDCFKECKYWLEAAHGIKEQSCQ